MHTYFLLSYIHTYLLTFLLTRNSNNYASKFNQLSKWHKKIDGYVIMVQSLQTIYRACKCSIIPTVIVVLDYMGEMPSQQWMLNKLALKKRNKMICEKINLHLLLNNNNTEEQLKVNGNFLIKFLNRCVVLYKNPKPSFV